MKLLKEITDKKPLILIVDDIPENLKVIGSILLTEHYNIIPATNGDMAIDLALNSNPDLILLDVQMPGKNGFDVCKILKSNSKTKNIPIIFLTAKTETDNIVNGFVAGGDDYIIKPFESKEMLARVKTHLQLKFSIEKLLEVIATKDKLFSIITHDLKGPFAAMLHISENLYRHLNETSKEEINETSKILNEAIKNAFDLLDNLLQWSKSETGRLQFLPGIQNLKEVTENSIKSINTIALNKDIKIINKIENNIEVIADINLLRTVIRNLISNAVKYTYPGGKVKIKAIKNDKYVDLTISDTGIGIPKKHLGLLFTLAHRSLTPGTNNESGTGLGLMLCKEFTEKMGGKIKVKSEERKGSSFTVSLPINYT